MCDRNWLNTENLWRTTSYVDDYLTRFQLFHHYALKTLASLALSNTYLAIYEEAGGWMLPFAISSLLKMIACYPFA